MVKTTDKVFLGALAIMLIGMSVLFVSAGGFDAFFGKENAKQKALQLVPGQVQEVDTEYENGKLIYEVDISNNGIEKEVIVNQQGEVVSVENEEADVPITGNALDKASQAALNYIGEGRVTDSEIGDEEGYYEIEIKLDNGNEADVHLDENFNILSVEYN